MNLELGHVGWLAAELIGRGRALMKNSLTMMTPCTHCLDGADRLGERSP